MILHVLSIDQGINKVMILHTLSIDQGINKIHHSINFFKL